MSLFPTLGTLCYFTGLAPPTLSKIIYGSIKWFTVVWPWMLYFWWAKKVLHLPSRGIRKIDVYWGLLTGICVAGFMWFLSLALGDQLAAFSHQIRDKVVQLDLADHYWTFGLFLSLVHSGIEEVYWRWCAYGLCKKLMPAKWAHIFAGIAFASHHVVVLWFFSNAMMALTFGAMVALGGILWSLLFERTGRLWASWLSHAVIDLMILWIGFIAIF